MGPAGTRANHAAVGRFASCQHHHCIVGVKMFSDLSLASLGSTEVFHIVTKWMAYEVGIHMLLLTAFVKLEILSLG